MTVWHDTIAVFGDVDVALRAVIVMVLVHVVLYCAAVYQWQTVSAGTNWMTHEGHHCSQNVTVGSVR